MTDDSMQSIYSRSPDHVRARFGSDGVAALAYYSELIQFIEGVAPPRTAGGRRTSLLDVGCGTGWSTYAFADRSYDAVGIDLNAGAFEPPDRDGLQLVEGSGAALPFADRSFDVVVTYQCLEHLPDPRRALDEMSRVCRPGGAVAVVGPNLVSPLPGLVYAARPSSWAGIPWRRRGGMSRHPYGNTVPEILGTAVMRLGQLAIKFASPSPRFTMREPDAMPPFNSDNDACYLCNPTDLVRYFSWRGFELIRRGKPGRPQWAHLLASGTWVAARRPSDATTSSGGQLAEGAH